MKIYSVSAGRKLGPRFDKRLRPAVIAALVATTIGGLVVANSAKAQNATMLAVGGTGKPEKTDINFGYAQTADHAPLLLGIKQGFFKEEGLNINARAVSPVNTVTNIVSGDLDVANITWIQYTTVAQQGISLRVVAESDRSAVGYTAFVVKSDSSLQKPEDLLGKKVGVVQTNGICDLLFNDTLNSEKIDYSSIRYTTLGIPNLVPTLVSGGVDAVCLPEPFLTPAKQQGSVRPLFDLFSGAHADWPITSYGVTAQFATKNPNTVGALQRALAKSRKYANEFPSELRAILTTYTTIDADLANKMALPSYPLDSDVKKALGRTEDLLKRVHFLQASK
jgi:NitT/TauT family transport system substrate-binding protein